MCNMDKSVLATNKPLGSGVGGALMHINLPRPAN